MLIRVETLEVESFFYCVLKIWSLTVGVKLNFCYYHDVHVYLDMCHCVRVFVQAVDGLTAVFGVVVVSSLGILGPLISSGL